MEVFISEFLAILIKRQSAISRQKSWSSEDTRVRDLYGLAAFAAMNVNVQSTAID